MTGGKLRTSGPRRLHRHGSRRALIVADGHQLFDLTNLQTGRPADRQGRAHRLTGDLGQRRHSRST
ncbi:hypothetical protein SALBM311S_09639 [Streptomyces alboniger]